MAISWLPASEFIFTCDNDFVLEILKRIQKLKETVEVFVRSVKREIASIYSKIPANIKISPDC
jgi:hypothetical protein